MIIAAARRATAFFSRPIFFAIFLLALCAAAYAPLISRLGFYWDDFPMAWIAATMGGDGLERYFSTNRPVWGLLYRTTTPLLGTRPVVWHLFAITLRWVTGLLLWAMLRQVWAGKDAEKANRKSFAMWAAALFVLYPGFSQQFIAFLYSHFFLVLSSFLLSLLLMALALRLPQRHLRWRLPLLAASLLFGLLNLISMEYFFLLDLLRPLLIWVVLSEQVVEKRARFRQTILAWLPYLIVFAAAMYWRSVLFGFQTYQPALMSRLKANPLQAVLQLIPLVFKDVWMTSAQAWAKAFAAPDVLELGARNVQRTWIFTAAGAVFAALGLALFGASDGAPLKTGQPYPARWRRLHGWGWQPVVIGIAGLFIAGGPFWLTDLKIGLVFPNDRFTLPFMLGTSLVIAGLLTLLPGPRWAKGMLLGAALGFAVGAHYQYAVAYNRDWSVQRSMFWQMTWRMPDLQPGTALLSNELPVIHYTDNSLTAPLNWTYDANNDPLSMEYTLLYPTLRKADMLSNFQKNTPIQLDYLAATFEGSTAQMVAFYYEPPGCLRVLDPEIDIYNWMVPLYLRESLELSTTAPILPEPRPGRAVPRPPEHIFGGEIQHGWCYYYEKADLARQTGDWQEVTRLGDTAFSGSDYPNDPLERFPFIEGYAHTGQWERSIALSRDAYAFSPAVMQPMVCKLWERIGREARPSEDLDRSLQTIQSEMGCSFNR